MLKQWNLYDWMALSTHFGIYSLPSRTFRDTCGAGIKPKRKRVSENSCSSLNRHIYYFGTCRIAPQLLCVLTSKKSSLLATTSILPSASLCLVNVRTIIFFHLTSRRHGQPRARYIRDHPERDYYGPLILRTDMKFPRIRLGYY